MVSASDHHNRIVVNLRRLARLWSLVSLGIILAFFIGEGFSPAGLALREWVGFFFFPLLLIAGLVQAWRYELWGGLLALLAFLGFYFIAGYLLSGSFPRGWAFAALAGPGLLFLICGLSARKNSG